MQQEGSGFGEGVDARKGTHETRGAVGGRTIAVGGRWKRGVYGARHARAGDYGDGRSRENCAESARCQRASSGEEIGKVGRATLVQTAIVVADRSGARESDVARQSDCVSDSRSHRGDRRLRDCR